MSAQLSEAALSLVGIPYRLHGRDPETGLDCVGLVAEALRRIGHMPKTPFGYTIRSASLEKFWRYGALNNLAAVDRDGDVVLAMVNALQPHLLVRTTDGFVHAHAGLRKVVYLPGSPPWPVRQEWRLLHI